MLQAASRHLARRSWAHGQFLKRPRLAADAVLLRRNMRSRCYCPRALHENKQEVLLLGSRSIDDQPSLSWLHNDSSSSTNTTEETTSPSPTSTASSTFPAISTTGTTTNEVIVNHGRPLLLLQSDDKDDEVESTIAEEVQELLRQQLSWFKNLLEEQGYHHHLGQELDVASLSLENKDEAEHQRQQRKHSYDNRVQMEALKLLRSLTKKEWCQLDDAASDDEEDEEEQEEQQLVVVLLDDDPHQLDRLHEAQSVDDVLADETPSKSIDNNCEDSASEEFTNESLQLGETPTVAVDLEKLSDEPSLETEAMENRNIILRVEDLLADARNGEVFLSTSIYNHLLLVVALTLDLSASEIADLAMTIYQQMRGLAHCHPDDTTLEILLYLATRRLQSDRMALDLILDIVAHKNDNNDDRNNLQGIRIWNRFSLLEAMRVCERRGDFDSASKIHNHVQQQQKKEDSNNNDDRTRRGFRIPIQVYRSMIKLAKSEDSLNDAKYALRGCFKEHEGAPSEHLHGVVLELIKWPSRNKKGKATDNTRVLKMVLEQLESARSYIPGYRVWKQLVVACAKGAGDNPSRWNLIKRALDGLSRDFADYTPDSVLLRHGLAACKATLDSTLASDLVLRLQHSSASLSIHDLQRAIRTCEQCQDTQALRLVLNCIDVMDQERLPRASQTLLLESGIQAYAGMGQAEMAEALLLALVARGVQPRDETFGAVIHSLASSTNHTDRAQKLFSTVTTPGPSCYNGIVHARFQSDDWTGVLAVYYHMKRNGIAPQASTLQSMLHACHHLEGAPGVLQFLQELLQSNITLDKDSALLAIRMVVPELHECNSGIEEMRRVIRTLLEQRVLHSPTVLESMTNLIRTLRMAEFEESRQVSKHVTQDDIFERRNIAWKKVVEALVSIAEH